MFLGSDSGLCAVRVSREEQLAYGCKLLACVVGQRDVEFLVHSLKLGMETTDDHILESVALNACPVLHLVRRNVLHIASHVGRGIGIGAVGSD